MKTNRMMGEMWTNKDTTGTGEIDWQKCSCFKKKKMKQFDEVV